MTGFVVVGELGTGKTLQAMNVIRDALAKGLPVATNIDCRIEKLVEGKRPRYDLRRLPDWPQRADFQRLGDSYKGRFDEKRFGWIVLDEAAVFLNNREWQGSADATKEEKREQAKARAELITWLRHARKHRWHTLLISQDLESLDAQVRRSLAQFVVQCRRLDSYSVPLLSTLTKVLGLGAIKLPQVHVGLVRLGSKLTGPPEDKWWLPDAKSLHGAYDTEQKLYGDNDGPATMLDHRHAPYMWKPQGWREVLWEVAGWRFAPPSAARQRYDDFRFSGHALSYPCKPGASFREWHQARAGNPGPLGAEGGEAAEPVRAEPLQEAA